MILSSEGDNSFFHDAMPNPKWLHPGSGEVEWIGCLAVSPALEHGAFERPPGGRRSPYPPRGSIRPEKTAAAAYRTTPARITTVWPW